LTEFVLTTAAGPASTSCQARRRHGNPKAHRNAAAMIDGFAGLVRVRLCVTVIGGHRFVMMRRYWGRHGLPARHGQRGEDHRRSEQHREEMAKAHTHAMPIAAQFINAGNWPVDGTIFRWHALLTRATNLAYLRETRYYEGLTRRPVLGRLRRVTGAVMQG